MGAHPVEDFALELDGDVLLPQEVLEALQEHAALACVEATAQTHRQREQLARRCRLVGVRAVGAGRASLMDSLHLAEAGLDLCQQRTEDEDAGEHDEDAEDLLGCVGRVDVAKPHCRKHRLHKVELPTPTQYLTTQCRQPAHSRLERPLNSPTLPLPRAPFRAKTACTSPKLVARGGTENECWTCSPKAADGVGKRTGTHRNNILVDDGRVRRHPRVKQKLLHRLPVVGFHLDQPEPAFHAAVSCRIIAVLWPRPMARTSKWT